MKIVVVEDNPNNLKVLGTILRQAGYSISVAINGKSALDVIEETMPDLILSDIRMPEMDGFEMCRKLKATEKTKEIPLIFLTASNSTEDETKALELGAVDFITKPINPPVVLARVSTHLKLQLSLESLKRENQLLNENNMLREDIEQISRHDLKSPLQAVITVPDLLALDLDLSPKQLALFKLIKEAGNKMLEMINSSLDLYKMERGIYSLKSQEVDILSLIKSIDASYTVLKSAKDLSLQITVNGEIPQKDDSFSLSGEELLFYSMISNFLKNCYEASPKNSEVAIILQSDHSSCQISLRNKGVVPEHLRPIFFDKGATFGKERGTGLGTYSASLIAKTLGATVRLDTSEADYTTVTITFPL